MDEEDPERSSTGRLSHFGETILGWFHHPPDSAVYHASIAEPVPGAITERIAAEARTLALAVSFGMTEKAADGLYNAQVLVSSDGTIAAVHRKINLRSAAFRAAEPQVTFAEIEGLCVAMRICVASASGEHCGHAARISCWLAWLTTQPTLD